MDSLNISYACYVAGDDNQNIVIKATIDNKNLAVPLDPANRHYAEIMRQVEAGELTIQEADNS